ncbi:MAG: VIT1/CCC1 transporter family protein, partial [Armatimonadota bacterium]|nr:VIT1/CCC1 transporter family protein [Armatimonadota bacterium]
MQTVAPTTLAILRDACRREAAAARMYRALAAQEHNPERAKLFERLANIEEEHAHRFGDKLREMGEEPPSLDFGPGRWERTITGLRGAQATIRYMEAEEERNAGAFAANEVDDPAVRDLFLEIEKEEEQHGKLLQSMLPASTPASRLESMLKREKWHRSTGSWIGDAIYGINDGLGAVFGIVSAVAGATGATSSTVLIAGLAGMVGSAFSMGSSAYLAAKSQREVHEAEIARERREIETDPTHEREELELLYQIKGFTEDEAKLLADRLTGSPEQFLNTMVREELG